MKVEVLCQSPLALPIADAILISSNARMRMGGGLSGAVQRLAGAALAAYCKGLPPLAVGSVVVLPGFASPFRWIIHAHSPNYYTSDASTARLLDTLQAALTAAQAHRVSTLSMGAFGTGTAQIPVMLAAAVTMQTLAGAGGLFSGPGGVRLCIANKQAYATYLGAARIRRLCV